MQILLEMFTSAVPFVALSLSLAPQAPMNYVVTLMWDPVATKQVTVLSDSVFFC